MNTMSEMRPVSSESVLARIEKLKKLRQAVILVHNYQNAEIQDVADYTGDSLELSRLAAATDAQVIVFCGVRFMAESAKILSPSKTVLLPARSAGCSMADMITAEALRAARQQYPGAGVVTYVNSPAEVKAESDICCTSANAAAIVNSLPQEEILFGPDKNLASWVAGRSDKKIIPWNGFCAVHDRITREETEQAQKQHPQAGLIVHPECRPEVCQCAQAVLSTSGMLSYVRESTTREFIIGTEIGLLHQLKRENPGKIFYPLSSRMVCQDMKLTTLDLLAEALESLQYPIDVPEPVLSRAAQSLEAMLRSG